jgi:hypothetical protein
LPSHKTKPKKSRSRRGRNKVAARSVAVPIKRGVAVEVPVPRPTTDVVTEKTYVTTEPEVEIRKPATLAQALTEPAVAVVKQKSRVRKTVVSRTRRAD